jgi:hypothetical protein
MAADQFKNRQPVLVNGSIIPSPGRVRSRNDIVHF